MRTIYPTILLIFCMCASALAQTPAEVIATLEIDTLLNHGPKDNRINFAFANVDHASAPSYSSHEEMNADMPSILSRFDRSSSNRKDGFSHYNKFFNIYTVWFPNPYVFVPMQPYYENTQAIIDGLFMPWADDKHGWITMMYTLKGGGGGGAGRRDDLRRGDALIWGLDWETVLHEFNHTMPGIFDEYTASGIWSNFVCGEQPNQSPKLVREKISWRNWIEEDTPIPTPYAEEYFGKIGAFEGTISGYFGCHRPTAQNCYMGAGGFGEGFGQDMCAVCLQRFICRLYRYVDAIENISPKQQSLEVSPGESMVFSFDAIKPEPNTQTYEWFLNGKLIAEGTESVTVEFGDCDSYELKLVLSDTTDFVRYDPDFDHLYPEPVQTKSWFINNTEVSSYNLDAELTSTNADCSGGNTGSISIVGQQGTAPYTYIINGQEVPSLFQGVVAGTYEVTIVDAKGCDAYKTITVGEDPILDFELQSSFDQGVWKIEPRYISGEDMEGLQLQWTGGNSSNTLLTTELGLHELEITTADGCTIKRDIFLTRTCEELRVDHSVNAASNNVGGAIFLDVEDGVEPYEIRWLVPSGSDATFNDNNRSFSSSNDAISYHRVEFLFDDIVQQDYDFWAEIFTGANYAGFDFGAPTKIDFYSLTSNVDVQGRDAESWLFQGSNDALNWNDLDIRTGVVFEDRLMKKEFFLQEEAEYQYYRIFVIANRGDGWLAIQEMEFGDRTTGESLVNRNKTSLIDVPPGEYAYEVLDANNNYISNNVIIDVAFLPDPVDLSVSQTGPYTVGIDQVNSNYDYLWFADAEAQHLLGKGSSFQPPQAGNYYVRAMERTTSAFALQIKGFGVSMDEAPIVSATDNVFEVTDPIAGAEYFWYDTKNGGSPIATGTTFTANEIGKYYVTVRIPRENIDVLQPDQVMGLNTWADASDLDANGIIDQGRENSSAYKWNFRVNGNVKEDNWFAYRSNYANGLGVGEFSTVWYQVVEGSSVPVRTIILAYEENSFSRDKTAVFHGLNNYIGKNEDVSKLYADGIDPIAKNGTTFVNGKEVDPDLTANTFEFKTLSLVMTQSRFIAMFATNEYWEGKLGELITYDRGLEEDQIKGLHEYLRRKWISTADLESPRTLVSWMPSNGAFDYTEEVTLCTGQDYLGLTEPGTYVREMKTFDGLDSIVTTIINTISEEFVPAEIFANGSTLSTEMEATSYQWYVNDEIIEGATNRELTATASGNYTVITSDVNGCMGESEAFSFVLTNVENYYLIEVQISPNPVSDYINIDYNKTEQLNFVIRDLQGKVRANGKLNQRLMMTDLESGIYFLEIINSQKTGRAVEKIIKI